MAAPDANPGTYGMVFNSTVANAVFSLATTLLSIPLFLIAYLVGESHPLGNKLSIASAATLLIIAFAGTTKFDVALTAGVLCAFAGLVGISRQGTKGTSTADLAVTTETVAKAGLKITGLFGVAVLIGVIFFVYARGAQYISWEFITGWKWDWRHAGMVLDGSTTGSVGGIGQYIVGSLMLVAATEAVALPLGLGAAVYLAEYAEVNKLTEFIRFVVETLAGIPSIVFGLIGYAIFVVSFGWYYSLPAAALSLAFMILPWNIRVAEEAMRAVPQAYREGAYALGATKWETIRTQVLYAGSPGIITGILLGVGAAIGETAVLIWTAGGEEATRLPTTLTGSGAPIPTLAMWVYNAWFQFLGGKISLYERQNLGLAGAGVLIGIFLIISLFALFLRNRLSRRIRGY